MGLVCGCGYRQCQFNLIQVHHLNSPLEQFGGHQDVRVDKVLVDVQLANVQRLAVRNGHDIGHLAGNLKQIPELA